MEDNQQNDNIVDIQSNEELQDVLDDNETVLVDFMAEWCGPCQMMEPVIEELADENEVVVAEIDIDSNQDIASDHNVQSVPTYIFYEDGELSQQVVGSQDKESMEEYLE